MKLYIRIALFLAVYSFTPAAFAQKAEAEKLADLFWNYIQTDSSAFVIKNEIGHPGLEATTLSETILSAATSFGKPVRIDRKGYLVSNSTGGSMGKGQYVCFNYRNKYADELLGENIVFEKLLFYRKTKTVPLKLVAYAWSKKGTDISCD
jgi:hypothetical protein